MTGRKRLFIGAFILGAISAANGQTPPPAAKPQMRANMPQPASKDDPAFEAIFDGKTMNGWEGDSHWRVEDGALVGQTTTENPIKVNTFLIWKGGVTKDFELRLEYRLSEQGNSGIQYRSEPIPDRPFGLQGYQADIDAQNRYTGQVYEEGQGRRGFLALRGQATRIAGGDSVSKTIIGTIGDGAQLQSVIKQQDWNEFYISARGNTIVQCMNGQVMAVLVDDDPKGRRLEGVLGLQLHVGPPMKIEFRNIRLKRL